MSTHTGPQLLTASDSRKCQLPSQPSAQSLEDDDIKPVNTPATSGDNNEYYSGSYNMLDTPECFIDITPHLILTTIA